MPAQRVSYDSYPSGDGLGVALRVEKIPRYLMPSSLAQHCPVVSIGRPALNILKISSQGRVAASFRRSLYLELDGGWCCLVSPQLGAGPLNIVTTLTDGLDTIDPNTGVVLVGEEFVIGGRLRLAPGRVMAWRAPLVDWSQQTLFQGLTNLNLLCLHRNPKAGLSRLVWPGSLACLKSPELHRAQPVFDSLRLWLRGALGNKSSSLPPKQIVRLLGLGPGLTPSGDDFLVGLFIALSLCGRRDLVSVVDRMIRPLIAQLTGPISRLHILAAIDGEGSERFHRMLNAVLIGDYRTTSLQLRSVCLIGDTSGWDALAGAVTVFRELIHAQ